MLQVHGFIFVVDATEANRTDEVKETFRQFLKSEKVCGKPVLLLCNKTDLETAQERDVVVDQLNVERLVNEARCPTRVDSTVANKAEGLKIGFKWLVKSVIANLVDLGPRVEADVAVERRADAKRREDLRKRIEDRKKMEEIEDAEEEEEEVAMANKGFVAMSELRGKWAAQENKKKNGSGSQNSSLRKQQAQAASNGIVLSGAALYEEPGTRPSALERLPKICEEERTGNAKSEPPPPPAPPTANGVTATTANSQSASALCSLPPLLPIALTTRRDSLDLEPVAQPKKKRNLMKRLNNRTSPVKSNNAVMPTTPAVRTYRSGSVDTLLSKPGSSKSVSSAESLRDTQVIKVYS
jgi:GTPase SAR1 family protein